MNSNVNHIVNNYMLILTPLTTLNRKLFISCVQKDILIDRQELHELGIKGISLYYNNMNKSSYSIFQMEKGVFIFKLRAFKSVYRGGMYIYFKIEALEDGDTASLMLETNLGIHQKLGRLTV